MADPKGNRVVDGSMVQRQGQRNLTGIIFIEIPEGTPITEEWVIEYVRKNHGPEQYAPCAVDVLKRMHMINREEKDAVLQLMHEMGVGEYINSRMGEAERLARNRMMEGRRSGEGMADGVEILRILRDIDYRARTPRDGVSSSDIADALGDAEDAKTDHRGSVRYDLFGHGRPKKR